MGFIFLLFPLWPKIRICGGPEPNGEIFWAASVLTSYAFWCKRERQY